MEDGRAVVWSVDRIAWFSWYCSALFLICKEGIRLQKNSCLDRSLSCMLSTPLCEKKILAAIFHGALAGSFWVALAATLFGSRKEIDLTRKLSRLSPLRSSFVKPISNQHRQLSNGLKSLTKHFFFLVDSYCTARE